MATFKVAGWDYDYDNSANNTVRFISYEVLIGISDTLFLFQADFPNVFLTLSLSSFLQ